jgi:hypothetical protein
MKKIKTPLLLLFALISMFLISGCQKDDEVEFQFGETKTDFGTETVYKAETNGFLNIRFDTNIFGSEHKVNVYSDNNENPSTEIGFLAGSGTLSLPIKKGDFWKVKVYYAGTINISFVPVLN